MPPRSAPGTEFSMTAKREINKLSNGDECLGCGHKFPLQYCHIIAQADRLVSL